MSNLKRKIFILITSAAMAVSASAQKDDQKKPPKDPPVIRPGEKPPRDPNPPRGNDTNKPKKPGVYVRLQGREIRVGEIV